MRYRIAAIAAILVLVVFGIAATMVDFRNGDKVRYVQHEESAKLSDLPEKDRQAAESTEIDPETFATHLPIVTIDSRGKDIPGNVYFDETGHRVTGEGGRAVTVAAEDGNPYITADVSTFDDDGDANRLSDKPELTSAAHVNIRGNTSRLFDKKSYKVVFVDEEKDGKRDAHKFLGMRSSSEWVLHGPELDHTLMRNYLTYTLADKYMNEWVPDTRFCEVFVNGEYKGVYLAVESIRVEEGRLELTDSGSSSGSTSYVVSVDKKGETPTTINEFLHYTLRLTQYMSVEYPSKQDLTEARKRFIAADISAIEKALFSYDFDSTLWGWRATMDSSSFVDMFLLNEFVINDDFTSYSTYLYKDIRGRLTLGPCWDYNNCYDNYKDATPADHFYQVERGWYYMLFKDPEFVERTIGRWRDLRAGVYSDENIDKFIDGTIDYLGPAIERNFKVWGYTFDPARMDTNQKLDPDERNPANYEQAVSQLREFMHARAKWMDENIEDLRQYCHRSATKKFQG